MANVSRFWVCDVVSRDTNLIGGGEPLRFSTDQDLLSIAMDHLHAGRLLPKTEILQSQEIEHGLLSRKIQACISRSVLPRLSSANGDGYRHRLHRIPLNTAFAFKLLLSAVLYTLKHLSYSQRTALPCSEDRPYPS